MELTKEQSKIFSAFVKCIDNRSLESMKHPLYEHLHLRCGFIAHYNIHRFKEVYSGKGFLEFIKHFKTYPLLSYPGSEILNQKMKDYVLEHAEQIEFEFSMEQKEKELKIMYTIANKYGYQVIETPCSEKVYKSETNGQMILF